MLCFQRPPCFSKSAGKRTPSRFPHGGPYGESCRSPQPSFTCLLNSSIKVLLIKKKSHSKALRKQTTISRTLLGISFGVPSKEALTAGGRAQIYVEFPDTAIGKYYSKTGHKIGN